MSNGCTFCGRKVQQPISAINRARKLGLNLYCDRICSGMGRRKGKTKAQRVEEKRLYDMEYRRKNRAMLKAKKAAYFQRTYDPVKAAKKRKKRMPQHVEYCRQPRYKAYKSAYDRKRRDSEYGPFAEAARLAIELNREIKQRMSNYEIRRQNETGNKRQERARSSSEASRHDSHSGA